MACKTINFILLLPTLLFVGGIVFVVLQAKTKVDDLTNTVERGTKELVLPSLEELRAYAEGSHALLEARFTAWAGAYNKQYATEAEKRKRLGYFAASARKVEEHNAQVPAGSDMFRLGLNEFADITDEEFMARFNFGNMQGQQECSATNKDRKPLKETVRPADLPEAIDWRQKGIVSPVKNQGRCGSCWTFSTTGALEAHYKKKTGRSVSLSEQQLLDCADNYDNHGCNGGLPSHAFQYILENGGLDTERAYPYEMKSEGTSCRFRKFGVGVKVQGVHNITQFDETGLEVAVGTVGPVSVAFQVASDFRLYAGGVYTSSVCQNQPKDVNHAVLAVGYGIASDGTKYWIIKNSWGESWGLKGYFMMKRGINQCGIADCSSYPIL